MIKCIWGYDGETFVTVMKNWCMVDDDYEGWWLHAENNNRYHKIEWWWSKTHNFTLKKFT